MIGSRDQKIHYFICSYANAAKKLASMLKEQPVSPKELVIRHAEFVAKFGTLKNLEPYGRHLSLIQYYLIDVILVVFSVLAALLVVVFLLMRRIVRKLLVSKKEKNE